MAKRLDNSHDRFEARVVRHPGLDACWEWVGAFLPHTNYGMFWPEGRAGGKVYAHRWSYEHFVGSIPAEMETDHLCHTRDLTCPGGSTCPHRRCVNPATIPSV